MCDECRRCHNVCRMGSGLPCSHCDSWIAVWSMANITLLPASADYTMPKLTCSKFIEFMVGLAVTHPAKKECSNIHSLCKKWWLWQRKAGFHKQSQAFDVCSRPVLQVMHLLLNVHLLLPVHRACEYSLKVFVRRTCCRVLISQTTNHKSIQYCQLSWASLREPRSGFKHTSVWTRIMEDDTNDKPPTRSFFFQNSQHLLAKHYFKLSPKKLGCAGEDVLRCAPNANCFPSTVATGRDEAQTRTNVNKIFMKGRVGGPGDSWRKWEAGCPGSCNMLLISS